MMEHSEEPSLGMEDGASTDPCLMNGSIDGTLDDDDSEVEIEDYDTLMNEHKAEEWQRVKAEMEAAFDRKCTILQTSLETERQEVASLKTQLANNHREKAELESRLREEKEEALRDERKECDKELRRCQEEHAKQSREKQEWCNRRVQEEEQECRQLKERHTTENGMLREQFRECERALAEMTEQKQAIDTKAADLSDEVARLRRRLNEEKEATEQQIALEQQKMTEEMEMFKKRTEFDLVRERDNLASLSVAFDRTESLSTETSVRYLTETNRQLRDDMEEQWARKENRYEDLIHDLERRVEVTKKKRYEEVEDMHAEELSNMEAEYEKKIRKQAKDNELKVQDLQKNLKTQKAKYLKAMKLLKDEQERMQELQKQINDLDTSLKVNEERRDQQGTRIQELESLLANAIKDKDNAYKQWADDGEKMGEKYDRIISTKEKELADLKNTCDENIREAKAECSERLAQVEKRNDDQKQEYMSKLQSQKDDYEARLDTLTKEKETGLQQASQEAQDREKLLREEQEKLVQQLKDDISGRKDELAEQGEGRQRDAKDARKREDEINGKHERKISDLCESHQRDWDKLVAEKDGIIAGLKMDHKAALKKAKDDAEVSERNAMKTVTDQHAQIERKSRLEKEKLEEKLDTLTKENAKLKDDTPPKKKEKKGCTGGIFNKGKKSRDQTNSLPDEPHDERAPILGPSTQQ